MITDAVETTTYPRQASRARVADWMLNNIVWFLLAVFVLAAGVISPYFLTIANLQNVLVQGSVLALLALAVAFALLLGGIDLSVVGVLGFSGAIGALLVTSAHLAGILAMLIVVAVGAVIGLFNGLCVARLRMNPLIATLAVGLLLEGAVLALTQGNTIPIDSASYQALGSGAIGGWPIMPLVPIVAFAVAAVALGRTRWGRRVYATGGNLSAARAAGIDVRRTQLTAFVTSGTLAGLAGVLSTAYLGGVNPTIGGDLLLYAVAAPVIGGVSLFGGLGRVSGIIGGALLLTVVQVGLQIVNISAYYVQMVGGAMILLAVLVDAARLRRQPT